MQSPSKRRTNTDQLRANRHGYESNSGFFIGDHVSGASADILGLSLNKSLADRSHLSADRDTEHSRTELKTKLQNCGIIDIIMYY